MQTKEVDQVDSKIQKHLENLLTRSTLTNSTLANLNELFLNGQNQRIIKMFKKLPKDAYYQATLKLKKDHQQTPKAQKLQKNLKNLQNSFNKLKVSQYIKQWNYDCLTILIDIKDIFQELQRENSTIQKYQEGINSVLKDYFHEEDDKMSPERFIQYILNHSNSKYLNSEEWQLLLFVKQKLYPPSEKLIQQRAAVLKNQEIQIKSKRIGPQRQAQNNNRLDQNTIKSQFQNQGLKYGSKNQNRNVFANNKDANNSQVNFNNVNNISGVSSSNVAYKQSVNSTKSQQKTSNVNVGKQSQKIQENQTKMNKIDINNSMENKINLNPNIIVQVQNINPIQEDFQRRREQSSPDQDREQKLYNRKQQYSEQALNQIGHQQEDSSDEQQSEDDDNSYLS